MGHENGKTSALGFSDIANIFFDEKFAEQLKSQKVIIFWQFMGRNYKSSDFRLGIDKDVGFRIFAQYSTDDGGNGTFVLDKNSLAKSFSCLFIPVRK